MVALPLFEWFFPFWVTMLAACGMLAPSLGKPTVCLFRTVELYSKSERPSLTVWRVNLGSGLQ